MSLAKQHKLSRAKLTAKRSSRRRPRREVTPSGNAPPINLEIPRDLNMAPTVNLKGTHDRGKARAAAKLRPVLYSHSVEVTLASPGHDPADFQRRLEALIDICQPENAMEMGLVLRLTQQITDLLTSIKQAARN